MLCREKPRIYGHFYKCVFILFRHLFTSLLVNAGVDIVSVSGALGHSTVSTTSNIYCHVIQEAQAKVSEAVCNALDFGRNKEARVS